MAVNRRPGLAHPASTRQNEHSRETQPGRPTSTRQLPLQFSIAIFVFLFRLVNALTVRTFFQPDEYFQALEPAWKVAFGDESNPWITWEWKYRLRSSVHPLLFAGAYKFANFVALLLPAGSRNSLLLAAPKMLQAVSAACNDYYTWKLGAQIFHLDSSPRTSHLVLTVLALSLANPWNWLCSVRTFSNSLETALTAYALSVWPWSFLATPSHRSSVPSWMKSFLAAAFATVLRPTNALIWICVAFFTIPTCSPLHLYRMVKSAAVCGGTVLLLSALSDRWFYGQWVLPAFRFVYFNLVQSLAQFYGLNRADYYWTEGIPLLLTTALPFAAWGIASNIALPRLHNSTATRSPQNILAWTVLLVPAVLSLIGHKEVRFLYPLMPAFLVLAAPPVLRFLGVKSTLPPHSVESSSGQDQSAQRGRVVHKPRISSGSLLRPLLCFLSLALNVLMGHYTSQTHQSGVIEVVNHLRQDYEKNPHLHSNFSVGFLMPCHSTPWRSHLIYPSIDAWALSCEPPVGIPPGSEERARYRDEADQFYDNPQDWLLSHMDNGHPSPWRVKRAWPARLVMFEALKQRVDFNLILSTLDSRKDYSLADSAPRQQYRECWRAFNTHWHDDWRRRGDVVVLCLESSDKAI